MSGAPKRVKIAASHDDRNDRTDRWWWVGGPEGDEYHRKRQSLQPTEYVLAEIADQTACLAHFHNRVRILVNIDRWDLPEDAPFTRDEWQQFVRDPMSFFIRCRDEQRRSLWAVLRAREERTKT